MRRKPAGARFARIDAPATETIRLFHSDGGLAVTVAGESSVATVGVDVSACDNARVRASGVCIVSAQENVRVWACDRVIVHAYDDARVWASGTCVVYAHEEVSVWAGSYVTVYKATRFGPFRGRVQGGCVVVKRDVDEMTGEQWCRAAIVHVDEDGMAHLFKVTDSEGECPTVAACTVLVRWWTIPRTGRVTAFSVAACMCHRLPAWRWLVRSWMRVGARVSLR